GGRADSEERNVAKGVCTIHPSPQPSPTRGEGVRLSPSASAARAAALVLLALAATGLLLLLFVLGGRTLFLRLSGFARAAAMAAAAEFADGQPQLASGDIDLDDEDLGDVDVPRRELGHSPRTNPP